MAALNNDDADRADHHHNNSVTWYDNDARDNNNYAGAVRNNIPTTGNYDTGTNNSVDTG